MALNKYPGTAALVIAAAFVVAMTLLVWAAPHTWLYETFADPHGVMEKLR